MAYLLRVITDISQTIQTQLIPVVAMSIVCLFAYRYVTLVGWEKAKNGLRHDLLEDPQTRRVMVCFVILLMVIFKTLLQRERFWNPFVNIMGNWSLHNEDGSINTEFIENILMFIPLLFCLYWAFPEIANGTKGILKKTLKISFFSSLTIEILQVVLWIGTFELSDLFCNTVGGLIGGSLYILYQKKRSRN